MQQPSAAKRGPRVGRVRPWLLAAAAGLVGVATAVLAVAGCGPTGGTPKDRGKVRPHEGVSLTVSCPDPALAPVLADVARVWAAGSGATVKVSAAPMSPGDEADVGVLPFAELGTWADRGELVPVPAGLKDPSGPYQWSSVLATYRGEPFAGWGGQLFALPLAGDGHVVVYRADRFADGQAKTDFQKQTQTPLAAPTTWEDFADVAEFFEKRDKRPSLPPLPADPAGLADLFFRVAACYDRPAAAEAGGGKAPAGQARGDALAFQFRTEDGEPRLGTAGFVAAARWLQRTKAARPAGADPGDPVAALAEGRAVLAVLSLGELARLRAEAARPGEGRAGLKALNIAPLPGTREVVDPQTGALARSNGNYVPYIAGGRLGVVRTRCPNPAAAFELLAELGGPGRSLELVGSPGLGAGPFRDSHLEHDRLLIWLGYGFDDDRSKALQDALRRYVGKTVRNPAYGLRGPDHAALTAALDRELRKVAAGEASPEEGMARAAEAWRKVGEATPPDKLRDWRRKAVGLN